MPDTTDEALLAELGLGTTETTTTAPVVGSEPTAAENVADATAEVADTAEKAKRAPRVEIKINKPLTIGAGLLPARVAFGGGGGRSGSKYPFADLVAPTVAEDGKTVTGYAFFDILLSDVENADEKKLQGVIQAAVAQQNKQEKEAGTKVHYVSRTKLDDKNAYIGSSVYRVDDTIEDAE